MELGNPQTDTQERFPTGGGLSVRQERSWTGSSRGLRELAGSLDLRIEESR